MKPDKQPMENDGKMNEIDTEMGLFKKQITE